jgi:hypothetical protein
MRQLSARASPTLIAPEVCCCRRASLFEPTIDNEEQAETTNMTDPKIPVTEDELHAFVDNELPAERRGDVEAWLAAHPEDAERVQ